LGSTVNNRLANTTYDAMGNQTQLSVSAGTVASYDGENRMSKIAVGGAEIASYTYDAEGRRVAKTANGTTTYYFYDAAGQLMAEYGGPAQTAATHYFTTDYLGSTRMILGATGNCLERLDYAPFGGQISRSGYDCYGSASNEKPLYTGQMRDGESTAGTDTGQDYFNARYFWANTARFTSPDAPFADQRPEDGQSWNMYAYVRNNPLRYVDPSGTKCVYNKGDSDQNTPIGDDGDGTGCPEAGVMPDSKGGLNASGQQVDVSDRASVVNAEFLRFWLSGALPSEIRYGQDDPATEELRSGRAVRRRRREYIAAGCPDSRKLDAGHFEAYFDSVDHALIGPPNGMQFQVGGHGGSITKSGGIVTYKVTNIAGFSSFTGHSTWGPWVGRKPNAWDNPLGPKGPMHNVFQTFEWSEADPCAGN
jgi:RHS repeat-associated protein